MKWMTVLVLAATIACSGSSTTQSPTPTLTGVAPAGSPLWRSTVENGDFATYTLDEAVIASDGALEIAPNGGHAQTDPYAAGTYESGNYYNGGSYVYATATSIDRTFTTPFNSITPSFSVDTPAGTWVEVRLQANVAGAWTKAYSMGIWAADNGTITRHSVDNQSDATGDVETDTLVLNADATALRMTVLLFSATSGATPHVRALAAIATEDSADPPPDTPDPSVWGTVLDVPMRSQMIYTDGGEVWCSPTSTSMLLAYWSAQLSASDLLETVPDTAAGTFDFVYGGYGNWPFNTAHGASMGSGELSGFVTRTGSFSQIEQLIKVGIPVAISIAFNTGGLDGAPISATNGHLIVVRGFAANGDVVCNDPAFSADAKVEVTYKRAQLTTAWRHSNGTTYVLYPRTMVLPQDSLGAFY